MKKEFIDKLDFNILKDDTENTFKKFVQEVTRNFETLNKKLKALDNNNRYNYEYTLALNFLLWFDWNKLYSSKLINEAKYKLHKDLKYNQIIHDTIGIDELSLKDHYILNNETLFMTALNSGASTINDYMPTSDYMYKYEWAENQPKPSKKELYKALHENSNKVVYDDYVKAVVERPYKFNKETVYNVYRYLLEILEKDKIASKYRNEV